MKKNGYIKQTIMRNEFVSLDETCYTNDPKPYSLGVKTRRGATYKTIACYEDLLHAELAFKELTQTIKSIIRYEKEH